MSMHEGLPICTDAGHGKFNNLVLEHLRKQRDSYAAFLLQCTRDDRERELRSRADYIDYVQAEIWSNALLLLDGIMTREKLLHPDEFIPLLCYPRASFVSESDETPAVDYYVQPRIITARCSDDYDNFRNWLIGESPGFFDDTAFIRAIPDLAISFTFFAKTDVKYSPEVIEQFDEKPQGLYIEQSGYIVAPDRRLDFAVSNTGLLVNTDVLSDIPDDRSEQYKQGLSNLLLYLLGQERRIQDQQIAMDQLGLAHYLYPDLDYVETDV